MKKGISQVISSTLLIAVAVSIAGLYAQWAPDFSQDTTGQVAEDINSDIKCRNAGVDISEAFYDKSGQRTTFELRNTGTISFYRSITVYALQDSQVMHTMNVSELEVDETQDLEIESDLVPDTIIASIKTCPSLRVRETDITVRS